MFLCSCVVGVAIRPPWNQRERNFNWSELSSFTQLNGPSPFKGPLSPSCREVVAFDAHTHTHCENGVIFLGSRRSNGFGWQRNARCEAFQVSSVTPNGIKIIWSAKISFFLGQISKFYAGKFGRFVCIQTPKLCRSKKIIYGEQNYFWRVDINYILVVWVSFKLL